MSDENRESNQNHFWKKTDIELQKTKNRLDVMKRMFFLSMLVAGLLSCNGQEYRVDSTKPISHNTWDKLVAANVTSEGWVDYEGFIDDREQLEQYLALLSNNPPNEKNWSKKERLAYWINAYNAFIVKLVIDNYPIESIKDLHPTLRIPGINSVWKKQFFKIGAADFSLSRIEHDILREMGEPRIHFAINCASVSCPSLRDEAYVAEKLEQQFNDQADYFLNHSGKNEISKNHIAISRIFKWFTADFTQNGTLLEFLNRWAAPRINEDAEVDYKDYNWSLNSTQENT